MNEQIEKLAKKAFGSTIDTDPILVYEAEKFAELIIKETLEVARAGIEYGNGMEDAVYKYFGVEK